MGDDWQVSRFGQTLHQQEGGFIAHAPARFVPFGDQAVHLGRYGGVQQAVIPQLGPNLGLGQRLAQRCYSGVQCFRIFLHQHEDSGPSQRGGGGLNQRGGHISAQLHAPQARGVARQFFNLGEAARIIRRGKFKVKQSYMPRARCRDGKRCLDLVGRTGRDYTERIVRVRHTLAPCPARGEAPLPRVSCPRPHRNGTPQRLFPLTRCPPCLNCSKTSVEVDDDQDVTTLIHPTCSILVDQIRIFSLRTVTKKQVYAYFSDIFTHVDRHITLLKPEQVMPVSR